jgi:hypothetical protein
LQLLGNNADQIDECVREYQGENKNFNVFKGMRNVLPADAFPSLEIEPTNASNQWATTRAQRPRYNIQFTLTVQNSNERFGVEYIATLATVLVEILTSPQNLQMQVLNETKWTPNDGLVDTFILDSLVEDVTYNSFKDGSLRTAEFNWFAMINETYPESMWLGSFGNADTPTILLPKIINPA